MSSTQNPGEPLDNGSYQREMDKLQFEEDLLRDEQVAANKVLSLTRKRRMVQEQKRILQRQQAEIRPGSKVGIQLPAFGAHLPMGSPEHVSNHDPNINLESTGTTLQDTDSPAKGRGTSFLDGMDSFDSSNPSLPPSGDNSLEQRSGISPEDARLTTTSIHDSYSEPGAASVARSLFPLELRCQFCKANPSLEGSVSFLVGTKDLATHYCRFHKDEIEATPKYSSELVRNGGKPSHALEEVTASMARVKFLLTLRDERRKRQKANQRRDRLKSRIEGTLQIENVEEELKTPDSMTLEPSE